jgi:hypothetical protein
MHEGTRNAHKILAEKSGLQGCERDLSGSQEWWVYMTSNFWTLQQKGRSTDTTIECMNVKAEN